MAGVLGICLVSVALTYGGLRYLQGVDGETERHKKYTTFTQSCLCIVCSEVICLFFRLQNEGIILSAENLMRLVGISVWGACLLTACVMDLENCMIYNYVWWVGGMATTMLIAMGTKERLGELVLFVLLQELFFCRMYGRADCHAFSVCAMAESALGMNIREYLLHMLLAFWLLAMIQGIQGNIGKKGNLKKPVAFLPYITVAFWGMLFGYTSVI